MDETQRLDVKDGVKIVTTHQEDNNNQVAQKNDGTIRQCSSAVIVNLLAFGFGSTVGWMSPVTQLLKSEDSPVGVVTDDQLSFMGSLAFFGGMIGTLIWGRIADKFGRKIAGYCVGASFVVGWSVILFSSWTWALYVGRVILGLGSGCFIVGPLYVTETAKDSLRGTLGSFVILFMNAGVVYAYALGAVLSYRVLTLACLTVPVVFVTCYFFLPETPTYLFSKNKTKEAESSLLWLKKNNSKAVQEEMLKLQSTMKKQDSGVGYLTLFESRGNKKAMVIGAGLFFFQQYCGILVVLTFLTGILTDSKSSVPPELATTLVGVFQLVSSAGSATIADKLGRKVLLVISYAFMALALFVLGLCFVLTLPNWVPFACLSGYMLVYPLGAGPLTYVVISETLAPKISGLATSTFVLWGTANVFLTVLMFPSLIKFLGYAGSFWFFSGWCILGVIFVILVVPETKGIPLVKVLAMLNGEEYEDSKDLKSSA